MRGVSKSILSKLFFAPAVLPLVLAAGCSDRDLRPLTPCTTSGASGNVPIQSLKNVDMIFLVDNSNSMASEQAKLRAEFPNMIRALTTGDLNGDGDNTDAVDGPAVESLRVAVITSDMGVLGVGDTTAPDRGDPLQNCGAGLTMGARFTKAHYGDDGIFRTQTRSVPLGVDCDEDNNGMDDVIPVATLPTFLTFDNPGGNIPDAGDLAEFNRRVSCLTNVGLQGCVFEQQLEALLKAITPSTEVPEGGPFHAEDNDTGGHGLGHGDDPNTNDPGGWFRDDSLLALVMVSDEDDCSARERGIFDIKSTTAPWNIDPTAVAFRRGQTRCPRLEAEGLWDVKRYIEGFIARRALSPGAFVFAAITGVPEDLTTNPPGDESGIIRGTDNLQAILDDDRMQYRFVDSGAVTAADIGFACQHFDDNYKVMVHADAVSGSTMLNNVSVQTATPIAATYTGSNPMAIAGKTGSIAMGAGQPAPSTGHSVTGTGVPAGTIITDVNGQGPFTVSFSHTLNIAASTTLTFGASLGPIREGFLFGTGIPENVSVVSVDDNGGGAYNLVLSQPITAAAGADIEIKFRDVEATPARRAVRVAQGLVSEPYFSNATINSICVDSFQPAMERIISLIQQNLRGSCLPRSLIRNAQNQVNCDVFVTMPPDRTCGEAEFGGAYAPDSVRQVEAPAGVADADGFLEVCRMLQVPVTATDIASNASPTVARGWFYDDYTVDAASCGQNAKFRVSFTGTGTAEDATPPQGARMSFSCAQPVQDGDLEIDINSPCNGNATAGSSCVFTTEAAGDEFQLRYNLLQRGFSYALSSNPGGESSFMCEFDSNTCQIACNSDAQCPGGFVCYDDPNDVDGNQAGLQTFCVNPVCGTN